MAQATHWKEHAGAVLDTREGFEVLDCESCGFKHVVPLPSPAELDEVYTHEFYSRDKPLYLERRREDREWWDLVYSDRYETIEELLGSSEGRILDIGSGAGFFLAHGRQRGWETLGIEPSRQAAAHARELGVEVVEGLLNAELARDIGNFDAVHMSQVLEHIPDPCAALELVHSLLRPGGLVCLTVPNDYSPLQFALREARGFDPWWVAPPHHLNYFDTASLRRLVESRGFEPLREEGSFPMELFLLMGDNYIGDDSLGRACHAKRKSLEQTLHAAGLASLKRELYRRLGELGLGRELVLIARRP